MKLTWALYVMIGEEDGMIDYLESRFGPGVAVLAMVLTVLAGVGFLAGFLGFIVGPPLIWAVRSVMPIFIWWAHFWGIG